MKTSQSRLLRITLFVLIATGKGAGSAAAQEAIQDKVAPQQEISCQGMTLREEALVRRQIQIMRPEVLPLRVIFAPHWKYVYITRIYHLHVPTGYMSRMFTHLPSRTVFVDTDRYIR